MPTDFQPAVRETQELMVFEVPSASHKGRAYRVDLLAEGGAGRCACTDWSTRRGPNIRAGLPFGTRLTMCRHVRDARRHFLNGVLETMAKGEQE